METGMDKAPRALILLTLLVCLNDGVGASNVVGYCGGSVSIKCEYDIDYGSKTKYFCRGEQGNCKELIRTSLKSKWFSKDRYSLMDNATHYFVVRISDLTASDAGMYYCGVRGEEPLHIEVNLEVKNDLLTCGKTLMRTVYTDDESMNITCPYLATHTQASKYLCKAFGNQGCNYRVSVQEDRTWVHSDKTSLYDDREKRVFTAMLGKLGRLDRGSYWCGVEIGWDHGGDDGYKALIQKVQLTVSDTRPTSSVTLQPTTPPQATDEWTTTSVTIQPATPPHTTEATDPETTAGSHTWPTHTTQPTVTGPTTNPTKLLPTSTGMSTARSKKTLPPKSIHAETDTTTHPKGSLQPVALLFSTAVPMVERSSSMWLMVIYTILALIAIVILSALLLYAITRRRKAKAADSSPCLVSMDAFWSSPLLPNELEEPLGPTDSDPSEAASPSASNTFLPATPAAAPTPTDSNTSEVIPTESEATPTESQSSELSRTNSTISNPSK